MQLQSNTELQNGKFRILHVLGQGGFGITYLAENVALGRRVAIKEFFPKDFCGRDETTRAITSFTGGNSELLERLKKRFLKEARNIAALDHPGIVKIHDIFEENGTAYYVMDYIEGENLNEMMKRDGAMPEARAVGYIRKVGETLSYIHGRNMTHFDVKPANIVVRRSDDMPILIDFGLSKQYDIHGDATSTLMQGVSSGYSPLEMYNPAGLTTFSPQTDVYSLGATLYFLLTGKVPPAATELVTDVIQLPSYLNPAVRNAIETAMRPGKAQRVESIDEFLFSLNNGNTASSDERRGGSSVPDDESTRLIGQPSIESNGGGTTPPTVVPQPTVGKNPGSAGKAIMWIFLGVVVILGIVIAITVSQCNSGHSTNTPVIDSTCAVDSSDFVGEIVYVEVDSVDLVDTVRYDYGVPSITTDCVIRQVEAGYKYRMYVPKYLAEANFVPEEGWNIYDNGESYICFGVLSPDNGNTTPEELVNQFTGEYPYSYKRATDSWAVRTGYVGNSMYYMRVARDGYNYPTFIYWAPANDENTKVYQKLMEKMSLNFPMY